MSRKMKDSGVGLIGEIPEDWEVVRNKYLFKRKKTTVGEEFDKYNLLSLTKEKGIINKDINSNEGKLPASFSTYQVVKKSDLVLCLFDIDISAVFSDISKLDGMISSAYDVFDVQSESKEFYKYWFDMINDGRKYKAYSKSLRYTINIDNFNSIFTVKPSINEQHQIATYLDQKVSQIDHILERTRKSIEEYKKYKQSIITEAVTKGLNPDAPMKDSGIEWIGEIPEEWEAIKASYVLEKIGDVDHYMPESVDNGIPYLMTSDLKEKISEVDFPECKQISLDSYKKLSSKITPDFGDVIFARYATIGTVCYVDIDYEFIVSYSCVIIKPKKKLVNGKFLYYYLKSTAYMEEIKKYINLNTQGNVGIDSLRKVKVIIPELIEQQQIAEYLDNKCTEIDGLISQKEILLKDLESYKKSLIYECVTGKKEIK